MRTTAVSVPASPFSRGSAGRSPKRSCAPLRKGKELRLLAEKCRLLCDRLNAKYPDEEDVSDFQAFTHSLLVYLGEEEQDEPEFDMEEVLNPKYPLDLSKLCKELGLMDEDA